LQFHNRAKKTKRLFYTSDPWQRLGLMFSNSQNGHTGKSHSGTQPRFGTKWLFSSLPTSTPDPFVSTEVLP
jgi:hypothetical protein